MPELDIQAILEVLPHRYPMLLVDRIEEVTSDSIVGIKNVTANEPYFAGHFPNFPVVPGVMIIESMAQVAGILVGTVAARARGKIMFLASVEEARFRKPVVPGDRLRIAMKLDRLKATVARLKGVATVDGQVVSEAVLMVKMTDRDFHATAASSRTPEATAEPQLA